MAAARAGGPQRPLIDPVELSAFEAAIEKTTTLRDRALPEAALAVAALLPSFFVAQMEILTVSTWHSLVANSGTSLAGWWFALVSAPLFRFILLRWVWRMLL